MHIKLTREQQRFWKRILMVDDDNDNYNFQSNYRLGAFAWYTVIEKILSKCFPVASLSFRNVANFVGYNITKNLRKKY